MLRPEDRKSFRCDLCGATFASEEEMRRHAMTHQAHGSNEPARASRA